MNRTDSATPRSDSPFPSHLNPIGTSGRPAASGTAAAGIRRRALCALVATCALGLLTAPQPVRAQAGWKPDRTVEIISGTAAGGAVDRANRVVQKVWQDRKIVEVPMVVLNKPGGGNTVAWHYINSRAGDAHHVSVAPFTLLTNRIVGTSPLTYTDFTVLSLLFNEYMVVAVKADSPIRDIKDLAERLRANPGAHSIAVASTLGNHIHISVARGLKAAGVDARKLRVVAFKNSGESITALLGGHIDVVSASTANVIGQLNAGSIRILAISAPQRMPGAVAAVPTWREQGIDNVFSASQGLIGPRGLNAAQVAFWESAAQQLAQADDWKKELAANFWAPNPLGAREAVKFYEGQFAELKAILTDLGFAKQ